MKRILSVLLAGMIILSAVLPVSAYMSYDNPYALGDVDMSDSITASDALLTLQAAVGKISLGYEQSWYADADENWSITASDALMVLQKAVGKIDLDFKEDVYESYEYNYVEPYGLEEGTVYIINGDRLGMGNYDLIRLFVTVQGLINRNVKEHGVGVYMMYDGTDQFWYDYITEEGRTFEDMTAYEIKSANEFFELFLEFIEECGMVVWDPSVPATSNVASTICGLENYLPVKYDTSNGSLYNKLLDFGIQEEMSLVGMFDDAKLGEKIADTDIYSTGSSKCDAYLWAMDKYFDRCNPEFIAYTLDGAPTIPGNPVKDKNPGNTAAANLIGITNHDYFILRQCFFMDLTSNPDEVPSDDPTQPLGTDHDTLIKILNARYELAGGKYGVVLGFPPWHVKYTNHFEQGGSLHPVQLEWHFVETTTAYNCAIEADAAHPCWMTNASLYTNFEITVVPEDNGFVDESIEYDENTRYYAVSFMGDFDCSPWTKSYVPTIWQDENHGEIYMTYSYNLNLTDRIPMVFNYVWENKTEKDFFVSGEIFGYTMPYLLFEGNKGTYAPTTGTTRVLPDGDRAFFQYAKPYYEFYDIDTVTRLLGCFMNPDIYELLNELAPGGTMMYYFPAQASLGQYKGVPYTIQQAGFSGESENVQFATMRNGFEKTNHFQTFDYLNPGVSYGTASGLMAKLEAFEEYVAIKDPDITYKYVNIPTLMKLLIESGEAVDLVELNANLG